MIDQENKRMNYLMSRARIRNLGVSDKLELKGLHEEYMRELAKNPLPKVTTGKTPKNRGKRQKYKFLRA